MAESAEQIAVAIASLQARRGMLGNAAVDLAITALREHQAALPSAPGPGAQAGDAEQHLRQVTILFVDVVGCTAIGRRLDLEDIQLLMDGTLRRLSAIVDSHHGRVLQYAGDNLLAVFGAEAVHEDDPENAVRAGLAIIDEVARLAQQAQQSHRIEGFSVRLGAHTGPVLLGGGVVGDNSVRGSAVNIAARMEQTAPRGGLRISQECHRHVRGLFDMVEQPPLAIKGFDRPLLTYLVQRARPRNFHASRHAIDGRPTRMIDRIGEAEQLRAAYHSLCTQGRREPAALFLVADAGIGKTRLLNEFSDWAAKQPRGARVFTARASERRAGEAYGLLRELLTSQLPMLDSDPAPLIREKWLSAIAPLLGSEADAAVLGQLLGMDFSAHEGVRGIVGEARQIRDRGYHYACEVLRHVADAKTPVLLLLDDLHWADHDSLDFVEYLLHTHVDLPLLLVGPTRPTLYERRPAWGGARDHCQRIDLPQLDTRYSEELVLALLERMAEVPGELRDLVVARAEGNPYYMEELVNMLVDQGAIVPGDSWQLQPQALQLAQLPTTLTGVLQARVDALAPELRRTLHHAAVVGHVFWDDALAALGVDSESALQELMQRQLILAHEPSRLSGMREFVFRHHTLHQVCYDSVLKRHRHAAHAKLARWLAAQPGLAHLDLIAEHFERGGDLEQAIDYWQRAAQQAAGSYANAAALAHAERGLALLPPGDLERRYALTLLCAKVLRAQSERTRLAHCLDELAALAERLGRDELRSTAAEVRARFFFEGGDATEALKVAQQALAWAPANAPECAARAQLLVASTLYRLGRPDAALHHAEASLPLARSAGKPVVEAMVLNDMGMAANDRGDPSAGIVLLQQALVLHRATRNRSDEAGTLANIAYAAFVLGDYAAARAQFLAAADLCHQVGNRRSEGIIQVNLAMVLQCMADPAGARDCAHSALRLLRLAQDRMGQAAGLRAAAHAELALGDQARAREHFQASRDLFEELGLGHLAIESIAGQALQALACLEVGAALEHVEVILQRLGDGATLAGTDEPLRIGLACHKVLAAAGDARAAEVLAATHAELQARALKISDPARRNAFLQNVPWHRELIQLWTRRSSD